jgi:hypothetical protein
MNKGCCSKIAKGRACPPKEGSLSASGGSPFARTSKSFSFREAFFILNVS